MIVYDEKDNTNYIGVERSKNDKYLFVSSTGTLSSKILFIDADKPESAFEDFQPRVPDMLYDVYPLDNKFLILTNWNAKNFRLMECPLNKTGRENWQEVIPVREDVLIAGIDEFKNFLVIKERKNGLVQMRINDLVDGKEHYLDFGEPAYTASSGGNPDYTTKTFRYNYSSLKTPSSVYEYDHGATKPKSL